MIEIVMRGCPVAKGRPRFLRATGKPYTPAKTQRYEDRLSWAAQAVMAGRPLLTSALRVTMTFYVEVPASKPRKFREAALRGDIRPTKKPDWDNFAKISDACNKVVWFDDSLIVDSFIHKFYSDQPRIEIRVEEIGPTA